MKNKKILVLLTSIVLICILLVGFLLLNDKYGYVPSIQYFIQELDGYKFYVVSYSNDTDMNTVIKDLSKGDYKNEAEIQSIPAFIIKLNKAGYDALKGNPNVTGIIERGQIGKQNPYQERIPSVNTNY